MFLSKLHSRSCTRTLNQAKCILVYKPSLRADHLLCVLLQYYGSIASRCISIKHSLNHFHTALVYMKCCFVKRIQSLIDSSTSLNYHMYLIYTLVLWTYFLPSNLFKKYFKGSKSDELKTSCKYLSGASERLQQTHCYLCALLVAWQSVHKRRR